MLLWKQGTNRYGVRVSRLSPITGDPTPEMVALDLRMLFVEEPQGEVGEPDADGRYWLDEDQEYLGRTHQR